jgi:hypothetical protein
MPSCTTPMFSKMPVTSQLTQPATLAMVQASGSAVATVPASMAPRAHSTMPMAAVPTSSSALSADSVRHEARDQPHVGGMACVCSSITSRT